MTSWERVPAGTRVGGARGRRVWYARRQGGPGRPTGRTLVPGWNGTPRMRPPNQRPQRPLSLRQTKRSKGPKGSPPTSRHASSVHRRGGQMNSTHQLSAHGHTTKRSRGRLDGARPEGRRPEGRPETRPEETRMSKIQRFYPLRKSAYGHGRLRWKRRGRRSRPSSSRRGRGRAEERTSSVQEQMRMRTISKRRRSERSSSGEYGGPCKKRWMMRQGLRH